MLIIAGVLYLIICKLVLTVDHNSFKSCIQSGFCNRNRILAENILNEGNSVPWNVEEVSVNGPQLKFKINRLGEQLDVLIQYLRNGALKLTLDPIQSPGSRYKIPVGDVIIDESLSTINVFGFESSESDKNVYVISGTGLSVKINMESFSISLNSDTDGEILKLNSENLLNFENGYSFNLSKIVHTIDEVTSNELWKEPRTSGRNQDTRVHGPKSIGVDISFSKSKAIYGIPEHATNLALKSTRGFDETSQKVFTNSDPYRLFNLDVFEYELDSTMALYGSIPIMMGHNPQGSNHRSVGVFWNNPTETWVDIYSKKEEEGKLTHWMSESGSFSLYIFAGKDLKQLQKIIKSLTGAPQLPPSFALGYHQCRWNYKSVEDVLEVHENFDKYSLPVDVIWLDIEHTDEKKYMSWHPTHFADPDRMINELSRTGRKLVTIVDPHLKKDNSWEIYKEIVDKNLAVKANDRKSDFEGDCWPGKSVWTDYTNPEARKWWASLFSLDKYKKSNENVYIWNDMNEPSVFNSPEITMPRDNIHHGGVEHREVHNLYGMYQQMSTFKGLFDRSNGRKRPFLLSRSFYAGSQRFGAVWTGDNKADWTHLEASGPMLMSLGVVGYHFSGADVGGFFGNPNSELLLRWYQAGAMQPFFRAHAHIETNRREPWLFGDSITSLIRNVLRLRYSLLPVWYTAMEESSQTGVPPMRPMFLEYPDDELFLNVQDQWMISSSLLFKPITSSGQKSAHVLLPKNNLWYNYFDMKIVENSEGKVEENELTLDKMLLYIRGGRIFGRKDFARRSSSAMKYDPFTIVIAVDSDGEAQGSLYIDDGDSYDYQDKDAFARIKFDAKLNGQDNVLKLKLDVTGESSLLPRNILNVNRIILINPIESKEIRVEFYLGESKTYEFNYFKASPPSMFVCVECGNIVNSLFSSYGKDNIILDRCSNCNEISDKYTEFDGVIKAIDLVLHKIPVYRHILINSSSFNISFRQILLFIIYLAMIEIHLLQPEKIDIYKSLKIFTSSIICTDSMNFFMFFIIDSLDNLIYSNVNWILLRHKNIKFKTICNALILGSFPQILHLLFVIWDYPRNDQFNLIINLGTFTSHLCALSAILEPNSKLPLFSIIFAHLLANQIKRFFLL